MTSTKLLRSLKILSIELTKLKNPKKDPNLPKPDIKTKNIKTRLKNMEELLRKVTTIRSMLCLVR